MINTPYVINVAMLNLRVLVQRLDTLAIYLISLNLYLEVQVAQEDMKIDQWMEIKVGC